VALGAGVSLRKILLPFWALAIAIGVALGFLVLHILTTAVLDSYQNMRFEQISREAGSVISAVRREVEMALAKRSAPFAMAEARDELTEVLNKYHQPWWGVLNVRAVDLSNRVVTATVPDLVGTTDTCAAKVGIARGMDGNFSHGEENPGPHCLLQAVRWKGQIIGGVGLHRTMSSVNAEIRAARRKMITVVLGAFALLYLSIGLLVHHAGREIRHIQELKERNERLAAMGNLAAGVAHEIRNPLNTLSLTFQYIERLLRGSPSPETAAEITQNFHIVHKEMSRLTSIVDNFIRLAKPPDLKLETVRLAELVEDTLALFRQECAREGIQVAAEVPPELSTRMDREAMRQCFVNTARNAIQAMKGGGTLRVAASVGRGFVRISFFDTGTGVSAENLPRVFEPYFTTKPDGLGIGLAMTRNIVLAHHGTIDLQSQEGKGTTVIIELPTGPSA